MKLIGLVRLEEFKKEHATIRKPLDAWIMETEKAVWKSPHSIKNCYKSADFLSDNRVIFNIKGNSYRLLVRVDYMRQIVLVEWVGTHAEYDKKRFS